MLDEINESWNDKCRERKTKGGRLGKRGVKYTQSACKIGENYPFIIEILQSLFPCALPYLYLPRLGDVGLSVNDSPVTPAPARRECIKVQRLAVRGTFHWTEHATEFLPGPGRALGAHPLKESWHFPGGRHPFQAVGCDWV